MFYPTEIRQQYLSGKSRRTNVCLMNIKLHQVKVVAQMLAHESQSTQKGMNISN